MKKSLKAKRDWKNSLDTSFSKGIEKGKLEEKLEIAKNMRSLGIGLEVIMQATGLSQQEIINS